MKKGSSILISVIVILLTCYLLEPAKAAEAEGGGNLLFIFDASGSMLQRIEGKTKLDTAREVLSALVGDLPRRVNVGLEVYGHRKANTRGQEEESCRDIETVVPVQENMGKTIQEKLSSLNAMGRTPIAASLERGAAVLKPLKGKKAIVLISDGEETCQGDPLAVAKKIRKEMGTDVTIHVIGFDVNDKEKQQLAGIAEAGGGSYYSADNAGQLKSSLKKIKKAVVKKDIFVDEFDKPFVSADWKIINEDVESLTLDEGKLYLIVNPGSVTKNTTKNIFLYNKPIKEKNYEVIVKFDIPLTSYGNSWNERQWAGLILYGGKNLLIETYVSGFYGYFSGGSGNAILAEMSKYQGGKWTTTNNIALHRGQDPDPRTYYLKIVKKKFKYTSYVSTDGIKWKKIGTLAILGSKLLNPGIFVGRGNGSVETIAEVDSFMIRGLE